VNKRIRCEKKIVKSERQIVRNERKRGKSERPRIPGCVQIGYKEVPSGRFFSHCVYVRPPQVPIWAPLTTGAGGEEEQMTLYDLR
jgi:hypothetical protein